MSIYIYLNVFDGAFEIERMGKNCVKIITSRRRENRGRRFNWLCQESSVAGWGALHPSHIPLELFVNDAASVADTWASCREPSNYAN